MKEQVFSREMTDAFYLTKGSSKRMISTSPGRPPDKNMVWIPGGTFLMGSDRHYPEEGPAHLVRVDGFWMDRYTVTNKQFQRFVKDTGYVTSRGASTET